MSNFQEQHNTVERVSKSQRKRESAELQILAAKLAKLSSDQLQILKLPDQLFKELEVARTIKKHGALKRQIKYIGGLLRKLEVGPILEGLDRWNSSSVNARRFHHRAERWRDRLLSEGDAALQDLLVEIPSIEWPRIRQLIRDANRQVSAGQPPTANRNLYQYLYQQLKER